MMCGVKPVVNLLRPAQWLKNGVIFLPIFFGGQLLSIHPWIEGGIVFLAFSLMASAVYCLNDLVDIKADRRHPEKCRRPLASGVISALAAKVLLILLAIGSICVSLLALGRDTAPAVTIILLVYLALNIAYSLRLKYIAIVDVFVVAFGFVLRLFAGGVSERIELSAWIVVMTFLLALFLAFAKRRDDVILNNGVDEPVRRSTQHYNADFMNAVLVIIASVLIVSYLIYTVSPDVIERLNSRYVYVSSVFVLAGVLRYLQIALVHQRSGSPTKVLVKDRFIQVCVAGWLLFFVVVLYLR